MSTAKNMGKEYELFVKSVFERLNSVDGLDNVEIKDNVKLIGASGVKHQIDVYWEFSFAGVSYRVAVECKNYKSRISLEKVRAFHDVITDIGGVKGIIAASTGFQSGALEYAKKCGIEAFVIRTMQEKDWNGRIRDVYLTINIYSMENVRLKVAADYKKCIAMGLHEGTMRIMANIDSSKLKYKGMYYGGRVDKNEGNVTLRNLINAIDLSDMIADDGELRSGEEYHLIYKFDEAYLQLEEINLPIEGILISFDVIIKTVDYKISGDDEILAIVYDMCNGTSKTVRYNGRVDVDVC